ncbi:cupin domain-containing protein [Novosphingobium sp. KCTC 2891]|uniref:cupin domain-containing protein n=1 Tax=Novosphingobium sp. KCTC 2891 TaxID=2989730 RepID=UPI002221591D|nr:cupin domain-containing protein [Novosphingobium sp. KCTC 2891]MCW1384251.1 cupin domain-containing protein [Novosphingobium sp. KCTC 2891]
MIQSAHALIDRLSLEPHPEGGWYRETWRGPPGADGRPSATSIHFLLESGQRSHWHTVDASEIWLWHAGDPVHLRLAPGDAERIETVCLGPDVLEGQSVQHVVPAGHWQAAAPAPAGLYGYALVSCVVAPGFDFAGFRLAPPHWEPDA